jgi:hypothetical protein
MKGQNMTKKKIDIKNVLTKLTPLALIANLASALEALGVDIPILDVKLEGDDLVITLYGGRIERFPLDYNLVIKLDKLDSQAEADQPVRLALSALGRDRNSPADWTPDVERISK